MEGSDEEGGDATGSLQAFSRPAAGPVASPGRGQRKTDPFRDPFTGLGPRRLSALSAFDSKLVWYGACAWARRVLSSTKRRFPIHRADDDVKDLKLGRRLGKGSFGVRRKPLGSDDHPLLHGGARTRHS